MQQSILNSHVLLDLIVNMLPLRNLSVRIYNFAVKSKQFKHDVVPIRPWWEQGSFLCTWSESW